MENKGKQKTQIEITRYYGRSGTKDPKGGPYLGKLIKYQDSTNIDRFCREVRYDSDNQTKKEAIQNP